MGEGTNMSKWECGVLRGLPWTRHKSYELCARGSRFQETFKTSRKTSFVLFREATVILAFFWPFFFVFRSAV